MSRLFKYLIAPLLALLVAGAMAADFTHLLPQDSVFTIGVEGLAAHEDKVTAFTDEWQRLDLNRLLTVALGEEAEDLAAEVPAGLESVDLMDLLGDEAWLSVSVSALNPLPVATLVARVSPAGAAAVADMLASIEGDALALTEGSIPFTVVTPSTELDPEDPIDAAFSAIAYAQTSDLVAVSSNPDALRGVLRRYQGASEPNLMNNPGFAATLGQLGAGNSYFFIDVPTIVRTVAPFGAGMGFDNVIARLTGAFDAAGVAGTVTTVTSEGLAGRSLRALGDPASDPQVHALLSNAGAVSEGTMAFVGPNTVSYAVTSFDLGGWWRWLSNVVSGSPELGISDLDATLEEMVGIDLNRLLIGWMGSEFASISSGSAPTPEIGTDFQNPLGDSVFAIAARDINAASEGLSELFTMASMMLAGFTSPDGMGMPTMPTIREVAGVEVTEYAVGEMFSIGTAFVDGYVLIGATPEALDNALFARQQRSGLTPSLANLRQSVPGGVHAYSVTDDSETMRTLAESMTSELSLLAGFAPGEIDFDAAEEASVALSTFLQFVADRMLGSYSYSYVEGNTVRSASQTRVAW